MTMTRHSQTGISGATARIELVNIDFDKTGEYLVTLTLQRRFYIDAITCVSYAALKFSSR
jgi:hypothetical protein